MDNTQVSMAAEAWKGIVQSGPLAVVLTVGISFLAKRVFAMMDQLTTRLQQNEDYIRDKLSITIEANTRAMIEDTSIKHELLRSNQELAQVIRNTPCQMASHNGTAHS